MAVVGLIGGTDPDADGGMDRVKAEREVSTADCNRRVALRVLPRKA